MLVLRIPKGKLSIHAGRRLGPILEEAARWAFLGNRLDGSLMTCQADDRLAECLASIQWKPSCE